MNVKQLIIAIAHIAILSNAVATESNTTQNKPEVIETMLVTAKGIEEQAIDVPFTINVIEGKKLQESQYTSIEEAVSLVPGVSVHSSGDVSYDGIWIRGVGSMSQTSTLDDNSVGITLDGLSLGKVGLAQNIYDISQVEITKGPQGTIFGSNTEAGAIYIKTNDPEFISSGKIGLDITDNKMRKMTATANTALSDTVAFRVAGMFSKRDSYIHERKNNEPINQQGNRGIRAKLLWQPNNKAKTLFTIFHDSRSNYYPIALALPNQKENPLYSAGDVPHHSDRETNGAIVNISHALNEAIQFTSNTAYAEHKADFEKSALPLDVAATIPTYVPFLPFLKQPGYNTQKQFDEITFLEQDLRLSSQPQSHIKWVGGIYMSHKEREFLYDARNQFVQPAPLNAELKRNYRIDTQAIYGEVMLPVTEKANILSGFRVTKEQNKMDALYSPNTVPANPFAVGGVKKDNQNLKDTFTTWRLGADYTIATQWRLYSLYSKGHKSQGFSDFDTNIAYNQTTPKYQSGDIQAVELGLKGADIYGRWQVNLAVFKNRTQNDKVTVTTFSPFSSTPYNVDTRAQGLEFDGKFNISESLGLNLAIAYTDTEVTKVPQAAKAITQKGNTMPQTPKWSSAMGIEHNIALNNDSFAERITTRLDINYSDKRAAEPNNKLILDSYTMLDASIMLASSIGELSLWGKNLTNEERALIGVASSNANFGLLAEGRVIGISYSKNF